VAERETGGPFKSLEDFCGRVDARKINKKALEALVKCGAFDFTGIQRAQLYAEIDGAMAAAASAHRDRAAGQVSLFEAFEPGPSPARKTASAVPPWSHTEKLGYEKELLGFYVTGHPLDEYRPVIESKKFVPIAKLGEQEDKSAVSIAGHLVSVEKKVTKKESKPFAVVVLEDLTAQIEVMIWSDTFAKSSTHLEPGRVVSISGRLETRDEGVRLTANEVKPVAKPAPKDAPLVLLFERSSTTEADLLAVRDILRSSPGERAVEFRFRGENGQLMRLIPSDDFRIAWTNEVQAQLAPWFRK
nr:OB-fold nucleic acid binding domain-containing protein [Verrucomicrobiota bacterium]